VVCCGVEMNEMPCRPARQRVLIADKLPPPDAAASAAAAAAADGDLPSSITVDVDLSDHPLGQSLFVGSFECGRTWMKFLGHVQVIHICPKRR